MLIRNAKDWWRVVESNWTDLLRIMYRYLPMYEHSTIDGVLLTNGPLAVYVETLKSNRDPELVHYLQAAWSSAPDNKGVFLNPGWSSNIQ